MSSQEGYGVSMKYDRNKTAETKLSFAYGPRSGFTLIELLVVISIMATLVALTVPAVNSAIEAGKRTKAQVEANALEVALRSYLDTYKVWPSGLGWGQDQSGNEVVGLVVDILSGDPSARNYNPRGIMFMEFPPESLEQPRQFLDPPFRGRPPDQRRRPYRFVVDYNYDNEIRVLTTEPSGTEQHILRRRAAVWSEGPPNRQAITSWRE